MQLREVITSKRYIQEAQAPLTTWAPLIDGLIRLHVSSWQEKLPRPLRALLGALYQHTVSSVSHFDSRVRIPDPVCGPDAETFVRLSIKPGDSEAPDNTGGTLGWTGGEQTLLQTY